MKLLLLQMVVVLLTALLCGSLARKLGQARVIGEIIGGILLGPSAFGRIAPHASQLLFPQSSLGALLNTRGLVELIVLNIAYNAHVFSPTLFTMLVVMALVTTMMTTPLLNCLGVEEQPAKNQGLAAA